jgi:DUF4097 and DUF4098 domain-containing protein YvlB
MRKSAYAAVIAVFVFVVLLVGVCIFADASDVFDSDSTSSNFFSELFSDDTQTNEYLITDTAADLDICLDAGTVEVLPSDDEDGIRVVETMSSSDSEENGLTYSVKNDTLYLEQANQYNIPFLEKEADATWKIYVPSSWLSEDSAISVSTQSASVEVSSFSLSELDIDSLSGDIDVSGISADYISLSSVSGAIRADSVEASVFECTSTSGNVRATLSADDVVFSNTSGKIKVRFDSMFRRADIQTISGAVTLSIPDNEGMSIRMKSVSGSFDCDFETVNENGTYTFGDGKIPLSVVTTSGSVNINKQ